MERSGAYRALIGGGLLAGVALGIALCQSSEPQYEFVKGAHPIRVSELHQGTARGTLRMYNIHVDWRSLLGLVQRESPLSVSKVGTYRGLPAETVVVPQMESGRAKLFETPMREITVVRGYFVQGKSGAEVAEASDGSWTGVRVVEYRQPQMLDIATDWITDRLRA